MDFTTFNAIIIIIICMRICSKTIPYTSQVLQSIHLIKTYYLHITCDTFYKIDIHAYWMHFVNKIQFKYIIYLSVHLHEFIFFSSFVQMDMVLQDLSTCTSQLWIHIDHHVDNALWYLLCIFLEFHSLAARNRNVHPVISNVEKSNYQSHVYTYNNAACCYFPIQIA